MISEVSFAKEPHKNVALLNNKDLANSGRLRIVTTPYNMPIRVVGQIQHFHAYTQHLRIHTCICTDISGCCRARHSHQADQHWCGGVQPYLLAAALTGFSSALGDGDREEIREEG